MVGQIALASFTNPGGLEKAGDSTYSVTNNSGEALIGESGIAGKGSIVAGALEMSNVDLAEQFTALFVSSSVVMGEDAEVIDRSAEGRAQMRHNSCPWYDWHQREGLLAEDLAGCDHFLQVVVDGVNAALGTSLRFETVESLPGGGCRCLRQFWEEEK